MSSGSTPGRPGGPGTPGAPDGRLRVALVLGGGGLTGTAFHAGVVRALADAGGWDARSADLVVGTSAGSTTAAVLRAGLSPSDYFARVTGGPVSAGGRALLASVGSITDTPEGAARTRRPASPALLRAVARRPWRYTPGVAAAALLPAGTRPMDPSATRLAGVVAGWPARDTWIPAVRLDDGVRVVFGRDATATLGDAVAASCAIPGYFMPVVIDGRSYVDGGAWSTNNLDLAVDADADVVLVSAPMSTADRIARDAGNLARVPVRMALDRQVARLRAAGRQVRVFQPDAALRELMGLNSMVAAKRAPVAEAVAGYVRRVLAAHPLPGALRQPQDG